MEEKSTKCTRLGDGKICCAYCGHTSIKNGFSKSRQRYKCTICKRTFQVDYLYKAYEKQTDANISSLIKEGCGIRSIGRLLKISNATVLRRILTISSRILKPVICMRKEYEVDELCSYVHKKSNQVWIVIALQRDTRTVADFTVGNRTSGTLNRIIGNLLLSDACKIFTDKLSTYRNLIPASIHSTLSRCTNHIERKNLSIRTHIRRLHRRTICFSKKIAFLIASLKIYFWS